MFYLQNFVRKKSLCLLRSIASVFLFIPFRVTALEKCLYGPVPLKAQTYEFTVGKSTFMQDQIL